MTLHDLWMSDTAWRVIGVAFLLGQALGMLGVWATLHPHVRQLRRALRESEQTVAEQTLQIGALYRDADRRARVAVGAAHLAQKLDSARVARGPG